MPVHRALVYVGSKLVLRPVPKTRKSNRLVELAPVAVEFLRAYRARRVAHRLAVGERYDTAADFVFADPNGAPLKLATTSRAFIRLQASAGLPRITLHGLRHSFATLGLLAGVPVKVISEMLGHSSAAVTESLNLHVTPGMKTDATNTIAKLIARQ